MEHMFARSAQDREHRGAEPGLSRRHADPRAPSPCRRPRGGLGLPGLDGRVRPGAAGAERDRGRRAGGRDLPPVHFVADPDSVIVERRLCRGLGVSEGGVLVAVGPIAGARGRAVTVATFLVSGCLGKNGQWLTYVLEPKDGSWRVVGTKGPIAIG